MSATSSSAETWTALETSTHQDHVIKHILGATVLGWFVAGEAAHLLLDVGFLWTIYLDAEMNLLPQGVAISEMEADDVTSVDKTQLAFDADLLLNEGREAIGLKRFIAAHFECQINAVQIQSLNSSRRVMIRGESAVIKIETSLESGDISIS